MAVNVAQKVAVFLIASALPALAMAQVYTWKDANGRTHFSDQPPSSVDAKRVKGNIVPETTEAPRANASAPKDAKASGPKTWEDHDRDFKQRQADKAEADAKTKKEQDAKAEKERYCASLRNNLAMAERGGRLAKPDAKGDPSYLSDSQISAEISQLRSQIAKDCK